MTEMEQEKRVSLNADVMLRRALDLKADNVLIAKFMELPTETMGVKQEVVYGMNQDDWYTADNLNYHLSWDWLMPVVTKVGASGNLLAAMKNLRPYGVLRTIEDTHQAVVEFINQLDN